MTIIPITNPNPKADTREPVITAGVIREYVSGGRIFW